jgi:5-methylcytosine-specific restriction endonuclease McrA
MISLRQKRPRLALEPEEYAVLKNEVLNRDGWKSQSCGSRDNLHVHHIIHRGSLGPDTLENLITLCFVCHARVHRHI